ncbi:hypothetical protein [Phenylobacterium sp.]|uniref:hypothetical protein n=1 Tax=Phenylobacterium sp. TaxID=1871053 RepID=UPI0025E27F58|nr:hypothetical protein [Phenylobacterium sp.]MBX3483311.1 hypothetical protein [Phenylobacterium sp.]MCW5760996.1 hypothetical protein [Phenylobacterium sp.]
MSLGLSHIGATPRTAAYALTPAVRTPTELALPVTAVKPVTPTSNADVARRQTAEQVMAERGLDQLALFRMGSQDRIRAEASANFEGARRDLAAGNQARAEIRATGGFLDLRI